MPETERRARRLPRRHRVGWALQEHPSWRSAWKGGERNIGTPPRVIVGVRTAASGNQYGTRRTAADRSHGTHSQPGTPSPSRPRSGESTNHFYARCSRAMEVLKSTFNYAQRSSGGRGARGVRCGLMIGPMFRRRQGKTLRADPETGNRRWGSDKGKARGRVPVAAITRSESEIRERQSKPGTRKAGTLTGGEGGIRTLETPCGV